jgi:hypothetical protein
MMWGKAKKKPKTTKSVVQDVDDDEIEPERIFTNKKAPPQPEPDWRSVEAKRVADLTSKIERLRSARMARSG